MGSFDAGEIWLERGCIPALDMAASRNALMPGCPVGTDRLLSESALRHRRFIALSRTRETCSKTKKFSAYWFLPCALKQGTWGSCLTRSIIPEHTRSLSELSAVVGQRAPAAWRQLEHVRLLHAGARRRPHSPVLLSRRGGGGRLRTGVRAARAACRGARRPAGVNPLHVHALAFN